DDPLVAVALGPAGEPGEVRAGAGLAEELAADEVAPVERGEVPVLHVRLRVVLDGGGDHAEADAEEALAGHVVLGLEVVVEALVGPGELPATVLARAGDVPEAGVVLGGPPRLRRLEVAPLLLAVDLLEHGHVVVALAPH